MPHLRFARVFAISARGWRIVESHVIARRGNTKPNVDYFVQSWVVKWF